MEKQPIPHAFGRACQNCKFFGPLDNTCRRRAPQVFLVGADQRGQPVFAGSFAPIRKELWCGEFEPEFGGTQ